MMLLLILATAAAASPPSCSASAFTTPSASAAAAAASSSFVEPSAFRPSLEGDVWAGTCSRHREPLIDTVLGRSGRPPVRSAGGLLLSSTGDFDRATDLSSNDPESSSKSPRQRRRSPKHYFATCVPGLQNALARELNDERIGASNVVPSGTSGVQFTDSPNVDDDDDHDGADVGHGGDVGLRALLWLRTAHRVMELVATTEPPDLTNDRDTDVDRDDRDDPPMTQSIPPMEGYLEPVKTSDDLYDFVRTTVPIKSLLGNGRGGLLTLSVHVIPNGRLPRELCHTHYTALTVKNALVDAVRDMRDDGLRPDVDIRDADVPLVVVLRGYDGREADVSLFRCLHSGGSLHRRGYRLGSSGEGDRANGDDDGYDGGSGGGGGGGGGAVVHKAALKESLAAGLLLEAGWDLLIQAARADGEPAVLVDPMAGSATLPIEAALIAADVAPGLVRIRSHPKKEQHDGGFNPHQIPPAVRWRDGNMDEWKALLTEAAARARAGLAWAKSDNAEYSGRKNCEIYANEMNPRAADLARACVANAWFDLADLVSLREGDCADWDLGGGGGRGGAEGDGESSGGAVVVEGRTIVVANPPWGLRLTEDIEGSWLSLRDFLRGECHGAEAWVLSGNKALTRNLRMKKSRSVVVRTADEDLRWIQYHIFRRKPASAADHDDDAVRLEGGSSADRRASTGKESWY